MRMRPHTQPTLSSSCDADRLWPRFPIPDDLFSVAEMALFVSSIDCSVHEGDPRKLHLMNTAHLNEKKKPSARFQQATTTQDSPNKQHTRGGLLQDQSRRGGVDGCKQLAARHQLSVAFTLDRNICSTNPANPTYFVEEIEHQIPNKLSTPRKKPSKIIATGKQ